MLDKPRHQPQLGRGVPVPGRTRGSRDCGPRSVQMGIDYLTHGDLVPTIEDIRQRMGKPGPVPTSTTDANRCVDSYDIEMRRFKRASLRYEPLKGDDNLPRIADAIARGEAVHFAILYDEFNERMDGKTGDPNFRGPKSGHSVLVLGWAKPKGKGERWLLFDPLDDHRRPAIPTGPRWVPRSAIVAAWKAFGSYAGILRGGERLAP